MNVARLMKSPALTLPATASLDAAWECLEKAGIRHLPVADAQGRLLGVVSQRDLARARDVAQTADGGRHPLRLSDIMRVEVLKVPPHLPAYEAATMMIEHKIGMLPVVELDERIVGILTETDFLEVAREALLGIQPELRARA